MIINNTLAEMAAPAALPLLSLEAKNATLTPQRLAALYAVVEQGSFTRAAEALGVTQPTVSAHVHALEEAVGGRLFERGRRGARLTDIGRVVYEYAVAVLRETATLRARLDELAAGQAGHVLVGVGLTTGTYTLPSLLAGFYARHPAVQVRQCIIRHDAIVDDVLNGRIDLGIVSELNDVPPALQAEPIWREPRALVAHPKHRLARHARVRISDLAGEAFVSRANASAAERALDVALADGGHAPRRILMIGHSEALKQAVLQNIGLAILFRRSVAAELQARQLVALPLQPPLPDEQFYLVRHRTHRLSPAAEALTRAIRRRAE